MLRRFSVVTKAIIITVFCTAHIQAAGLRRLGALAGLASVVVADAILKNTETVKYHRANLRRSIAGSPAAPTRPEVTKRNNIALSSIYAEQITKQIRKEINEKKAELEVLYAYHTKAVGEGGDYWALRRLEEAIRRLSAEIGLLEYALRRSETEKW